MRVDQKTLVSRVGRRRLLRHVSALRFSLAEAEAVLASGTLDPTARERLEIAVARIEREIDRLQLEAATAPASPLGDYVYLYDGSARD